MRAASSTRRGAVGDTARGRESNSDAADYVSPVFSSPHSFIYAFSIFILLLLFFGMRLAPYRPISPFFGEVHSVPMHRLSFGAALLSTAMLDSARADKENVLGQPLQTCSSTGMAMTGFTRDGYCTE